MDLRDLDDRAKRALVACAAALMLSLSAHGPIRVVALAVTLASLLLAGGSARSAARPRGSGAA